MTGISAELSRLIGDGPKYLESRLAGSEFLLKDCDSVVVEIVNSHFVSHCEQFTFDFIDAVSIVVFDVKVATKGEELLF